MVTAQGFTQICLREIAGHLKCSCKKHVPHICAHVLKISLNVQCYVNVVMTVRIMRVWSLKLTRLLPHIPSQRLGVKNSLSENNFQITPLMDLFYVSNA